MCRYLGKGIRTNLHDLTRDRRLQLGIVVGQIRKGVLLAGGENGAAGGDRACGGAGDASDEGHGGDGGLLCGCRKWWDGRRCVS